MEQSLWQQGIYKNIDKIQCIPLNSILSREDPSETSLQRLRKDAQPVGACLKEFGPGKLCVKKVWAQNIYIFINFRAELNH